jgi:hypothetical protein
MRRRLLQSVRAPGQLGQRGDEVPHASAEQRERLLVELLGADHLEENFPRHVAGALVVVTDVQGKQSGNISERHLRGTFNALIGETGVRDPRRCVLQGEDSPVGHARAQGARAVYEPRCAGAGSRRIASSRSHEHRIDLRAPRPRRHRIQDDAGHAQHRRARAFCMSVSRRRRIGAPMVADAPRQA